MDYYSQFKPGEDSDVVRFGKELNELAETVKAARRNLERGRDEQTSLGNRITELRRLSGKSLAGGAGDYEKFKTSLRKLKESLETADEAVMSLENDILPGAESALRDASLNLSNALQRHLIASRHIVDLEIDLLLCQCMAIIGDFMDAFRRIYGDCDVGFIANNETYYPGPWTAEEIGSLRRRLGMDAPPQAEPTPVELTPDTPEAAPELVEPEFATTMLGGEL